MDEKKIPQILCEYLNGAGLISFMPEVWRDGCGAIFLGEASHVKDFVDGSSEVSVRFEAAIRTVGHSAAERLKVVGDFASLAEYARNTPINDGAARMIPIDGAKLYGIYSDCSEYRCTYELRYAKKG